MTGLGLETDRGGFRFRPQARALTTLSSQSLAFLWPTCHLALETKGVANKSSLFLPFSDFVSSLLLHGYLIRRETMNFICMWFCSPESAICHRDPPPGPSCSSGTRRAWSMFQESLGSWGSQSDLTLLLLERERKKSDSLKTKKLGPTSILHKFPWESITLTSNTMDWHSGRGNHYLHLQLPSMELELGSHAHRAGASR